METKKIKLYYSRFENLMQIMAGKWKFNLKQLYDDKYDFKYKSLFLKSTVE